MKNILNFLDKLYLKLFYGYLYRTCDGNYPCPKENMTDLELYIYEEKTFWHDRDRTWPTFHHFVTRKIK